MSFLSGKNRDGTGGRGMGQGGSGQGRGGSNRGLGPGGYCVCPSCGKKVKHRRGVPCMEEMCPECGSPMNRE